MPEYHKEEVFFRVKYSLFNDETKHVRRLSYTVEFANNAPDYAKPQLQQVSPRGVEVLLHLGDKLVTENDKLLYDEEDVSDAAEEALVAQGYCVIPAR